MNRSCQIIENEKNDKMELSEMQEEFLRQQNELRDKIEQADKFDMDNVKLIAGVDLAYWNNCGNRN